LEKLIKEIRTCTHCEPNLPCGANPILRANKNSKIALVSQAPGRVVHNSGVDWTDKSGQKLREWLDVTEDQFYNTDNFAVVPISFCYPGKGKTGDLPPRKECAPLWHDSVFGHFENLKLTILIGAYATRYYLPKTKNLTSAVQNFETALPDFFPLPHPSPLNQIWRSKNRWFGKSTVPELRKSVHGILRKT
jgi:uracil-DNA glycosylase